MSGGVACCCAERREPLIATGNRPPRLWRVSMRHENRSAFNGYHPQSSSYSAIVCLACGASWRTKSPFVDELRDMTEDEFNISPGRSGHHDFMVANDRQGHARR